MFTTEAISTSVSPIFPIVTFVTYTPLKMDFQSLPDGGIAYTVDTT